jgi:hypothetical protein
MLWLWTGCKFGALTPDRGIMFEFDPDGKETDGTLDGPGKALRFHLYADGTVRSEDFIKTDSYICTNGPYQPYPISAGYHKDPPWFSWD